MPARLAQQSQRSRLKTHERRRLRSRRATKLTPGSDWRGGRAGASKTSHFSGPASGVAGDRGDDLVSAQRTRRSGVNAAPGSSSSGLVHAKREGNQPAVPGHGNGPLLSALPACLCCVKDGSPSGARRWPQRSGSTRDSLAPRSGETPNDHVPNITTITRNPTLSLTASAVQVDSDRKSTRLNSSHERLSRMPSSA